MKHIISTIAALAFVISGFVQLSAQVDCNTCDLSTPNFTLYLVPSVAPPTNGPNGFGTTDAQFEVFFFNNTANPVDLATIEFSMGINDTELTSMTGITTDATVFPNTQQLVFAPSFSSVTIIDNPPVPYVKTINGETYTLHYEYDETVSGDQFPTHVVPAGATEQILTVFLTLDGSQTFVDNDPGNLMFLGDPRFITGYSGECLDNDANINNQFGFVDDFGNQLLINCYQVVTGAPPASLPVELTEFSGVIHDQVNKLKWRTQVEINTRFHHVERSINPSTHPFREIGKVPAAGNTEASTDYTLDDETPPNLAYYRLKTSDHDGEVQYSDIIVLERRSDFDLLSVYPNPTMGEFEVKYSVDNTSDIQVEIVDVLGRVLQTHLYTELGGIMKREFDLSPYTDGVYILRITNGVETRTKEVIKSRP